MPGPHTAEYMRIYRERKKAEGGLRDERDPRHGTPNGYTNMGCRRECCRSVMREQMRARRATA